MAQTNLPAKGTTINATHSRIFVTLGRGDKGKSFLIRTVAERALAVGREVGVCDCDPGNRTSAHAFAKREGVRVFQPRDLSAAERDLFIRRVAHAAEGKPALYCLDVGGNDQAVANFSGALCQVAPEGDIWGTEQIDPFGNVDVTIAFLLGGDPFDVPLLDTILKSALISRNVLLVHNEGVRRTVSDEAEAWDPTTSTTVYKKALEAGARPLTLPAFDAVTAHKLTRSGSSFQSAIRGDNQDIGLSAQARQRLQITLREFESLIRGAGVESWFV